MRQETIDVTTSVAIPAAMTRREKLMRWAGLVRATPYPHLMLFSGLESYRQDQLAQLLTDRSHQTAFGVALSDPVLLDAGLGKPGEAVSIAGHMAFFELSQQQLHEFSCGCGGAITNDDMANRIERIANAT